MLNPLKFLLPWWRRFHEAFWSFFAKPLESSFFSTLHWFSSLFHHSTLIYLWLQCSFFFPRPRCSLIDRQNWTQWGDQEGDSNAGRTSDNARFCSAGGTLFFFLRSGDIVLPQSIPLWVEVQSLVSWGKYCAVLSFFSITDLMRRALLAWGRFCHRRNHAHNDIMGFYGVSLTHW